MEIRPRGVEFVEVVIGPDHLVLAVRPCVRPVGRTQWDGYRNEPESDGEHIANHVRHRYFFEEPGEVLEHFLRALVQILMFFVGVVGERVTR